MFQYITKYLWPTRPIRTSFRTVCPSRDNASVIQNMKFRAFSAESSLQSRKEKIKAKKGFIVDMNGVLYQSNVALPGVSEFINWLQKEGKQYLFLTNSSDIGTEELSGKILRLTGVKVPAHRFYTSALATAAFLKSQTPLGSAFVIGSSGLQNALFDVGYTVNDVNPDYVVVGETNHYSFHMIERAVFHVKNGSKLIGTNKDLMDRVGPTFVCSTGALVAPIELITNTKAYFVGKPNPLIMSRAMTTLKTSASETVIIGDRMETDVQAGLELGLDTVLLLSGVTQKEELKSFAFKPTLVLDGIKDLLN